MVIAKRVPMSGRSNLEFRAEIFNLFDTVNFSNPVGTLPLALPGNATTEANKLQPGQPVFRSRRGNIRPSDEHRRPDGRSGHATAGSVRAPRQLLNHAHSSGIRRAGLSPGPFSC